MRLQLFREHLGSEINLPKTYSQSVQSHAVTTAMLLRYIVTRLKIEGVTIPDGDGGRPHELKPLLSSFIHYEMKSPRESCIGANGSMANTTSRGHDDGTTRICAGVHHSVADGRRYR